MRLFVGLWPPPDVVERLAELARPADRRLRWTTADQWHVTVSFLGEVPEDAVEDVAQLVLGAASVVGKAEVEVGPATVRLGAGVLCLPVAGLEPLAAAVSGLLEGSPLRSVVGARPEGRPFRGHLTLARARGRSRVPGALTGIPFEARWVPEELSLISSTPASDGGSRYETVRSATIH